MGNAVFNVFEDVYNRYHHAVYLNILKLVKRPEVAEDILQEVFLTYWEKQAQIDNSGVAGWLFVVSFNKSLNALRREMRQFAHPLIPGLQDVADQTADAESEADFDNRWTLVGQAIENLPPARKQVLILSKLEGKSPTEIAGIMKISVDSVRDYQKKAMRTIREIVSDLEPAAISVSPVLLAIHLLFCEN